jgi:hypothetical protein
MIKARIVSSASISRPAAGPSHRSPKDGHLDAFAETPKGFVFQKSGLSGPASSTLAQ